MLAVRTKGAGRGRYNATGEGAPFYKQLLGVLDQLNRERQAQSQPAISFRQAVQAMGLQDSFTGKIKSGKYVPTLDRLEILAKVLNLEPNVFDAYVKRYAVSIIEDEPMMEVFRLMSSLKDKSKERILQEAVYSYVSKVFASL